MRSLILLCAVLALGCRPLKKAESIRTDQGTRTEKTWCEPGRGLPADPTLGLARPLRFGVGSIVHEYDSTTETFAAARAFTERLRLPERQVTVGIVEHPSDAHYSVMGSLRGEISYAREMKMGKLGTAGAIINFVGYGLGGTFVGTGMLVGAISDEESAMNTITSIGFMGVFIGAAGHLIVGTRPANRYSWDQTAVLTLRRGTVVIGEFEVRDVFDDVQWNVLEHPRQASTAALWRQAAVEISACIAADLGTGDKVAEVAP